ncbi:MAG: signal peptide peptidase SppA [Flavobacteriales bacterium]|nr:signal peptide peptidase SppA [Flavobacteriales bacterium]
MGQFFKFMFASMLGTLLIGVVLILLFFAMIAGLSASFSRGDRQTTIKDGSVLHLTLDKEIVDRGSKEDIDFDFGPFSEQTKTGLNTILAALETAKTDDRIEGVFLDLGFTIPAGFTTLREIREKIIEFRKESGKPVVAWAELYTQGTYYVATAADAIYLQPKGDLDYRGLHSEYMFLKGMFEKLDIDVQFIRGSNNKFKSFGEIYTQDHMSDSNRVQIDALLKGLWADHLAAVSGKTGLDAARLNLIVDSLMVRNDEDALELKLIDGIKYRDEVLAELRTRMGLDEKKDIKFVELGKYRKTFKTRTHGDTKADGAGKLAIIYAEGGISSGESEEGSIGSTSLSETIRKAREDSTIKAIVFRVNSPGGSGLASEVIWREVKLASEVKPVVVSMGDVAASGGYYISCPATKIYAEPTTITGSIGVFGIIPNMQGFFNNKLGITFDGTKTHRYADMMTTSRALTAQEKRIIQGYVDEFYEGFVARVSEGRKLTKEQVDAVGQGRVWTGVDAKERGLVDELGGLEDAVKAAAELANLTNYREVELPAQKDFFQKLMEDLSGDARAWAATELLGDDAQLLEQYKHLRDVKQHTGIQARMPFDLVVR